MNKSPQLRGKNRHCVDSPYSTASNRLFQLSSFPTGVATKAGQQDVGHAIVATGRGALRLPRRYAPACFSANAIPVGVKKSPFQSASKSLV